MQETAAAHGVQHAQVGVALVHAEQFERRQSGRVSCGERVDGESGEQRGHAGRGQRVVVQQQLVQREAAAAARGQRHEELAQTLRGLVSELVPREVEHSQRGRATQRRRVPRELRQPATQRQHSRVPEAIVAEVERVEGEQRQRAAGLEVAQVDCECAGDGRNAHVAQRVLAQIQHAQPHCAY